MRFKLEEISNGKVIILHMDTISVPAIPLPKDFNDWTTEARSAYYANTMTDIMDDIEGIEYKDVKRYSVYYFIAELFDSSEIKTEIRNRMITAGYEEVM